MPCSSIDCCPSNYSGSSAFGVMEFGGAMGSPPNSARARASRSRTSSSCCCSSESAMVTYGNRPVLPAQFTTALFAEFPPKFGPAVRCIAVLRDAGRAFHC